MLEKYRATMTGEVLHSWAADAQKEIDRLTNKVAGLEEMYSELFEHHKERKKHLARRIAYIREVTSERNKYQKWYIETENENASLRKEVERLKEIDRLTNKVAGLEEMYSELFEHHKETEEQLAEANKHNALEVAKQLDVGEHYGSDDGQIAYVVMLQENYNQLAEARAENERLKEEFAQACVTIARMHQAATGEIRGPKRGVVEDVYDAIEQASQQTAMEIIDLLLSTGITADVQCVKCCALAIKAKFGLEEV